MLEAETLTKLACLTTIEAFWCEKETSNKVVNLRNLHNLQDLRFNINAKIVDISRSNR